MNMNVKKTFWKNSARACFASLALFAVLAFSSCANMTDDGSKVAPILGVLAQAKAKGGEAVVSLALGLKEIGDMVSRTVQPTAAENSGLDTLSDIKFYAKLLSSEAVLGTDDTLLASWESHDKMLRSQYEQSFAAGTYDFMISAKRYGATMKQTLRQTVSAGTSTTLNFTSLAPDAGGAQTGALDLSFSFYASDKKQTKFYSAASAPYPAISISVDSTAIATKDSSSESLSMEKDSAGYSCEITKSGAKISNMAMAAGFHIVTVTFTASDSSVYVYPTAVYIEAGYLSKGSKYPFEPAKELTLSGRTQSHTVTYNSNTSAAKTATQTFYKGSSLADAEALAFAGEGGKRFKGWNTAADGSGTPYKAGESPDLAADTILYAQWAVLQKVTYLINLDGQTETYVQYYESGDSLVGAAAAFPNFAATGNYSKYAFCGWDTKTDGSEKRYAASASPTFSADTVLYAQWCGAKIDEGGISGSTPYGVSYAGYYPVSDAKQWNALMGAPFANETSGVVNANVLLAETIESPAFALTSGKAFGGKLTQKYYSYSIKGLSTVLFDKVSEGAEISKLNIYGAVCNTNAGTIKSVTVQNMIFNGGLSAIAKENAATGTIESCYVKNCAINGAGTYAGGICGLNKGTIKDCNVTASTVDGAANSVQYTGGICGYNQGTISATSASSSKVDITLLGSDAADARYGYVIGKNSGGTVSKDIVCTKAETTTKPVQTFSGEISFKLTLTRTAKVTVTVTDGNTSAKTNGMISKYSSWNTSNCIAYVEDVDGTSKTFSAGYLEKGTYYIIMDENYILDGYGGIAWTVD